MTDTLPRGKSVVGAPVRLAFLSSSDHSGFLKAEIAGTTLVRCADNHMIVQSDLQDSRSFGDASG
jgi:hypothetical protein